MKTLSGLPWSWYGNLYKANSRVSDKRPNCFLESLSSADRKVSAGVNQNNRFVIQKALYIETRRMRRFLIGKETAYGLMEFFAITTKQHNPYRFHVSTSSLKLTCRAGLFFDAQIIA